MLYYMAYFLKVYSGKCFEEKKSRRSRVCTEDPSGKGL